MSQARRPSNRTEPVRTAQLESSKFALDSYLASMLEEATDFDEEDDLASGPQAEDPTLADLAADGTPAAMSQAKPGPVAAASPKPTADVRPDPVAPTAGPSVANPIPDPVPQATVVPVETPPETPQVKPRSADTQTVAEAVVSEAQLAQSEQPLAWGANGRPAWAARRFDCLLFKVDGLALAVPMVLLGTIFPMDRELTPLFGQPDWFLGLLPVTDKRNIKVIETARLVMPERYRKEAAQTVKYAVGIHGCDWALACHEVIGSITLEPDEVKWRSERTRRPWLAGTVVEHMCALIDLEAFEQTLLVSTPRAEARR